MAIDIKPPQNTVTNPEEDHGEILMEWRFPEYEQHKRGKLWYIVAGIISVLLLIWAIFTFNYLFALIVVIVDLIVLFQANRQPDRVDFKILEEGLIIGTSFHPYKQIKNFSIIYKPPVSKTLYITFNSAIRPEITIPLENKNPLRIRDILLEYLKEDLEREEDSGSEQFKRLLKL